MYERFERIVVQIMKPLDGLAFLFILINGMIGITILADRLGSRLVMFVGCGTGLVIYAVFGFVSSHYYRSHNQEHLPTQQKETNEATRWQRMPLQFIGYGLLCVAVYFWAMIPAKYWPSIHPFRGDPPIRFVGGVLLATASGPIVVGIAGLADPRICFAIHRSTRKFPLPWWTRLVAWSLLLGGFAAGGYLAFLIAR